MRIFLDDILPCDLSYEGMTTNPIIAKKRGLDYHRWVLDNLDPAMDISVQLTKLDLSQVDMLREFRIKVPIISPDGETLDDLVARVADNAPRINVTCCTSRALVAAAREAVKGHPDAIISYLGGRAADGGEYPFEDGTGLLYASVRSTADVLAAERAGFDICTVPVDILRRIGRFPSPEAAGADVCAEMMRCAQ